MRDDIQTVINHRGVSLFYHMTHKACRINIPIYLTFEHVCVHLECQELNLLAIVIYRPGTRRATESFISI